MKTFLFGLILLPVLVITVLSLRPGGLRRQLRHAARRLRLVLVLGGAYFLLSGAIRVISNDGSVTTVAHVSLALGLAVIFLVFGQARDEVEAPRRR